MLLSRAKVKSQNKCGLHRPNEIKQGDLPLQILQAHMLKNSHQKTFQAINLGQFIPAQKLGKIQAL